MDIKKWLSFALLLVMAALAGACTTPVAPPPAPTPSPTPAPVEPEPAGPSLADTAWALVSYGDPAALQQALADRAVTARFDAAAGVVSGTAGCNGYSGGFAVDGDRLTVTSAMATLMACIEDGVMAQEQSFLSLLQAAESYAVQEGRLHIVAADGQTLIFAPQGEVSGERAVAEIVITEPSDGTTLNLGGPVLVRGTGKGLFEGNVVVRFVDGDGNVLWETATILLGDDVGLGGEGTWELNVGLMVQAGTPGMIQAFSTSPVDGSVVTMDSVAVTFGAGQ